MAGRASASSWLGQATRTMSQPDAVSSAICCSVALMSVVGVVVIDCTLIGRSPPTPTLPTRIWRVLRPGGEHGRGERGHAEGDAHDAIIPAATPGALGHQVRRVSSVGTVLARDDVAGDHRG